MGEIIRTWLRTRLGVIIDLSPEVFGRYANDGTLLAKLLHSYDIINENQLRTLNRTQDPALSRVNLKNLRIWLRFIGVDCNDECIEDISNGKGTIALRLFYKVFLALENKDSLHFITLQKEREKFIPNSSKFDVTIVTEEPEPREPEDHPLAGPLKKGASLIEWQRKRYNNIIEGCMKEREKFCSSQERMQIIKSSSKNEKIASRKFKPVLEEAEKRELDEFAKKHRVVESKKSLDPCEEITKFHTEKTKIPNVDHEAAKAYTKSLKQKYHQEAMTKSFKTRMQKALLSEVWEKVVSDQEKEFDEIIARKVLSQSQYEKKMIRKLCDIRNEKMRMASNRQIVEELSQKMKEKEARLEEERAREVLVREKEEVEAERRRMDELERRINEDMARRKQRKLRRIGEDAVNDLIDISARVAEYKIASNDNNLPKSLWNQWKALFVRCQPIFDAVDEDIQSEFSREELEEEEIDEVNYTDFERADVMNDDDFENYHNVRSPWNDFVSHVDVEIREFLNLGLIVLGYIVHKVLESLFPRSVEHVEPSLPNMNIKATVLGIPDTLLYEPIRELLKHSRIHLVCLEDAINHCLEQYKTEMKDYEYIDLNIVFATRKIMSRQSSASTGERGKKLQKKEKKSASSGVKTASTMKKLDQAKSGTDKVTQTPRVIPYEDMDPNLSDTAYIGKWTHEFLTLGQPLSDDLIARILLEYLKSLKDVQGFVLINYPTTYKQMTSLEFALTGRKLPDNGESFFGGEEDMNIEEIDPVPSRISFEDEGDDSLNLLRKSRLVPDPLRRLENSDGNSYFNAFVTIKPKSNLQKSEDQYEILPDVKTSLEAFYADQKIASVFYYTIFDLSTLKRLARFLITGDTSLPRIPSQELFGEAMEIFEGRRDNSSISNAPIVKKLLSRASVFSFGESEISEWTQRSYEADNNVSNSGKSKEEIPRPGEPEWLWANFSQPLKFTQTLANIWQNLESSYIENLKDVFQLKRTNFEAIVPYTSFVKRHMKEFIERPDKKQDLLHEFHRAFNDIEEDIRDDMEVKRELYCRIADFEMVLWEICNERRKEAEEERKRIILNHWTTQEAIILTNVYIGLVQAEIDRCADTLQFIQDYYLAILQRPLQEVRLKVQLRKIPLETQTSGSKLDITSVKKVSLKSLKEKESKESRMKISSLKISSPPSCVDESLLAEEIAKLLMDQQENFDVAQTICYKSIEANIQYVQRIVESMASSVLDILKKEEIVASKSTLESKEKKRSSRKVSQSSRVDLGFVKKRAQDLVLEWRYALMFEINRIQMRLKMLNAAAKSDINFLIDSMQRLFFGIQKLLVDRFKNEMNSVNLMASTFRFAIEEATPIQKEMLLDGDRFLVRSNVLMYPDKSAPGSPSTREEISSSNFQMAQLGRLLDIFRRIAPSGTLAERSFVYILQDLIACGVEDGEIYPLPSSWLQLRACDVPRFVNEIFGDVQFVDWREFIIYAMDIEMPNVDQLLDALEAFRKIDKNITDTVSYEEFHSLGLWFFDWDNTDALYSRSLLHENFEIDEEDTQEKEEIAFDFTLDKRQSLTKYSCNEKNMKPESIMRLTLAKELLSEMFLSKTQRVNYMALLLAFCKDEEPKKGFGKALSLAIGKKICIDWKEGEKYVEELIKKRRRSAEERANLKYLHQEASLTSKAILKVVLKGVLRNNKADARKSDEVLSMTKYDNDEVERVPIRIEKLDAPGESVDPADLLPPDDKIPISLVNDANHTVTPEEFDTHDPKVTINLPENCEERKLSEAVKRELVYWLNLEVCQTVLAAMLPRLATQPDIFETNKSLRENIRIVCLELRDEELNDEAEQILAHRFLEHNFVKKVIFETSQFMTKHLGNIVNKIHHENK